jgi:hypothetical protein
MSTRLVDSGVLGVIEGSAISQEETRFDAFRFGLPNG